MAQSPHTDNPEDGISSFDLQTFSPLARRILRVLLRQPGLTHQALLAACTARYPTQPVSSTELQTVLQELSTARALLLSADPDPTYQVRLRRTLPGERSLWETLEQPSKRVSLLDTLDFDHLNQRSHRPDLDHSDTDNVDDSDS